jgi:hypothetical protein
VPRATIWKTAEVKTLASIMTMEKYRRYPSHNSLWPHAVINIFKGMKKRNGYRLTPTDCYIHAKQDMVPSLIKGYRRTLARFLGRVQSDLPNVHLGKTLFEQR